MKHIFRDENGVVQYDLYFEYLKSVEKHFPPHVYSFAADVKYYSLHDHGTLHDAWLDYLHIVEPAEGERRELRKIEIDTYFLGPFHDRRFFLSYTNVTSYSLNSPSDLAALPINQVGHGDFLIHEFRIHSSGNIIHEMEFSRGSTLLIRCGDLIHREELFPLGSPGS